MKVRLDYVTNSSSSSFVVNSSTVKWGEVKVALEKLLEARNIINNYSNTKLEDIIDCYADEDDYNFTIDGAYDNSIPYFLQEFLEYELDAKRIYLG